MTLERALLVATAAVVVLGGGAILLSPGARREPPSPDADPGPTSVSPQTPLAPRPVGPTAPSAAPADAPPGEPTGTAGTGIPPGLRTPHGIDFSGVSTLYGISHVQCSSVAELQRELAAALGADGTTVIHVRTDRAENVALHRRVWEAVRDV